MDKVEKEDIWKGVTKGGYKSKAWKKKFWKLKTNFKKLKIN